MSLADLPWPVWVIAGGVGLVLASVTRKASGRGLIGSGLMRDQALGVSLAEDARWGDQAPDTQRVDEYLAGVIPHGRDLVAMNTDTDRVNFCAAAVGWSEHQTGFPDLPPWRSGAKQLMYDSQNGLRGPWHPRSELARGWRPPVGALAVYTRGDPSGPFGHVDRVVRVHADGYDAVGANAGGRKWNVALRLFSTPALLGFVVDGETPAQTETMRQLIEIGMEPSLPANFVEPLLTKADEEWIQGFP